MNNQGLLTELVDELQLDLAGLNVYTEAASGHYIFSPILAAVAGASHVTAQVADSTYGLAKDIIKETEKKASQYGVSGQIECVCRRSYSRLSEADVITNSGNVRP